MTNDSFWKEKKRENRKTQITFSNIKLITCYWRHVTTYSYTFTSWNHFQLTLYPNLLKLKHRSLHMHMSMGSNFITKPNMLTTLLNNFTPNFTRGMWIFFLHSFLVLLLGFHIWQRPILILLHYKHQHIWRKKKNIL